MKVQLEKVGDEYVCRIGEIEGRGKSPEEAVNQANSKQQREYYFLVTLWERQFSDYFINYCIPSLISPGNIPSLPGRPRFIIACPEIDWNYINQSRYGRLLSIHCDVEWIPFNRPAGNESAHRAMGRAHVLLTQRAYEDKAYGVLLTPDFMLADGSMKFVEEKRQEGYKVVLTCALRSEEESLFSAMQERGVNLEHGISRRDLAYCAVNGNHSETKQYEWLTGYFTPNPSAVWWRMDKDQMLIYTLSWNPIMVDYSALRSHDDEVMKKWTIDGDYIYKNFGDAQKYIYVCQDSDEIIQVSWSPKADRARNMSKSSNWKLGTHEGYEGCEKEKARWLNTFFWGPSFEPLKRRIFFIPAKWHFEDLTEDWDRVEKQCTKYLHEILDR